MTAGLVGIRFLGPALLRFVTAMILTSSSNHFKVVVLCLHIFFRDVMTPFSPPVFASRFLITACSLPPSPSNYFWLRFSRPISLLFDSSQKFMEQVQVRSSVYNVCVSVCLCVCVSVCLCHILLRLFSGLALAPVDHIEFEQQPVSFQKKKVKPPECIILMRCSFLPLPLSPFLIRLQD